MTGSTFEIHDRLTQEDTEALLSWSVEHLFGGEARSDWWRHVAHEYRQRNVANCVSKQQLLLWYLLKLSVARAADHERQDQEAAADAAEVNGILQELQPLLSTMTGRNFWATIINSIVKGFKDFADTKRVDELLPLYGMKIMHYVGCDSCAMMRLTASMDMYLSLALPQRLEGTENLNYKLEEVFKKTYARDCHHICRRQANPVWSWKSAEFHQLGGKLMLVVPRTFQEDKDGVRGAIVSYKPTLDLTRFCRDEMQDQGNSLFGLTGIVYLTNIGQSVRYATINKDSSTGLWIERKDGQYMKVSLTEVLSHQKSVIYLSYAVAADAIASGSDDDDDDVTCTSSSSPSSPGCGTPAPTAPPAQLPDSAIADFPSHSVDRQSVYVDCYSHGSPKPTKAEEASSSLQSRRTAPALPARKQKRRHAVAWLVGLCIASGVCLTAHQNSKQKKRFSAFTSPGDSARHVRS